MSQSTHPPSADGTPPDPAGWTREQWDEYLRRHRRPFYRIITGNPGLGREHHDEVYTDTCSGLWEARDRLNPARPVFSYACRIAVNLSRSKIRELASPKRRRTRSLSNDEKVMDPDRTGADKAGGNEAQRAVREYLEKLPPTDRLILVSRGLHHDTWDEVAAKAGMPRTTVVRKYDAIVADARVALASWAP